MPTVPIIPDALSQMLVNIPWAIGFFWLLKYVIDANAEREQYFRSLIDEMLVKVDNLTTAINSLCIAYNHKDKE